MGLYGGYSYSPFLNYGWGNRWGGYYGGRWVAVQASVSVLAGNKLSSIQSNTS
ncbi:hypothetical protein [Mucilaginibacter metallidurans]|uniref:hypothetical protein n=1 Tax=Mucilaginibacter sp. P4 TaxID=3383180 RepID=UPI00142F06B4|nr:hypothetical protein [Mucilaginibacter gossypii]